MEEAEVNHPKCHFCSTSRAKYTCPRCCVQYCSQLCYKSEQHSDCSEQFYKECVEEELKLNSFNNESKSQMIDILNRVQNQTEDDLDLDYDSDDGDSIPDLSERIQNIDLDDADELWSRLTEQEKLEFNAILNSGDVTHLIPEYEPWWNKKYEKKVEELESFFNQRKEYEKVCPPLETIVPFSSLSKLRPSPCILWNIVNVLSAYVFTVRRFVGEHNNNAAVNTILILSTNLNANQNFDSKETAIQAVVYQANSDPSITCSIDEGKVICDDVDKLLAGPRSTEAEFYVLVALSDLQRLFKNTLNITRKTDKKNAEFSKKYPTPEVTVDKEKTKKGIKKLIFYSSWIKEFYRESSTS